MNTLDRVERIVFESKFRSFVFLILILTVFKTGIWYIPNIEMSRSIAQNPFVNPFPDPNAHYLFWNWFGPFLAWAIGAQSKYQFLSLHLLFSILFTATFIRLISTRLNDQQARISLIIFACLPVSATAYFWVSADSITLFLLCLGFLLNYQRISIFFIGILLGMQHFEQAFIAVSALSFALILYKRINRSSDQSISFPIILLLGVIVGRAILGGIFTYNNIQVNSGRLHWLKEHVWLLLNQFFFHFHQIIWSMLGLGWLVFFKFVDQRNQFLPLSLSLFGISLLLPFSGDQTRVYAIISFPLIAYFWLLNSSFLSRVTRRDASGLFLHWLIVPWSWVWGGHPRWSVFPYNVAFVLNKLFGLFEIPPGLDVWPFN